MTNKEFIQNREYLYESFKKAYDEAYLGMAETTESVISTDDEWEDFFYDLSRNGYAYFTHTVWAMASFYFKMFQEAEGLSWIQMRYLINRLFHEEFGY